MATQIYVNLPVKDLNKSVEFFTQLKFKFDPMFTDENATCMIIGDNIYAMLLVEPFFKTFIKKPISDATKSAEVILALSAESKDEVDEMIANAKKAGATIPMDVQDQGFMYSHGFQDLDGHLWEVLYMDKSAFDQQP